MLEDPRLSMNNVRVPRRDNYEKRLVLSATIHPDLKRTLVVMSERTGLSISQVTDEVLYAGLGIPSLKSTTITATQFPRLTRPGSRLA